ncbi:hypothetical protein D3C72_741670 [compost metagenome]
MHRWRLMYTTRYWFKIMNTKSIWKIIPIPTHYIKRMRSINHFMHHPFFFNFNQKVSFFIMCLQFARQNKIAFTKRRVFQMLSGFIFISLRSVKWGKRFNIKQSVFGSLKIDLINHSAWNDKIVPIFKRNIPHHGS